jgi:hypothetical protein
VASLFWLDVRRWWPFVPVFVGVVAPAERCLHWCRWLLVGNAALRPTFTEVGHLTAFAVGLATVPLAPARHQMPYPPQCNP